MRIKYVLPSLLCLLSMVSTAVAQSDLFSGTFMTPNGAVTLQLKPMPNELHGVLVSAEGMFALQAQRAGGGLQGTVFTNVGNYGFTGEPIQGGWSMVSEGITYTFYQTSTAHDLAQVDLTPYFKGGASNGTSPSEGSGSGTTAPDSGYSGEEETLFNYIAGGQLVYYQRTSILNDSNASSITYINFCADGRFNLNYDGGFSVEGDYGNAQGASRGSNYGTWKLEKRQGVIVGILNFANGTQSVEAINKNYLLQGRWRIGNTQYAFVRNKAVCR